MITHYMLALAIALLFIIAIDDLHTLRMLGASLTHSKLIQNKISRNIRKLRVSIWMYQKRLKRA